MGSLHHSFTKRKKIPRLCRPRAMAYDQGTAESGVRGKAAGEVEEGAEGVPSAKGTGTRASHPRPAPVPERTPLPCTVPPAIKTGLPDLSITEGAHALLPCTATGSPEPKVTWEKDGQPVSGAKGKFTIQPSGELLVKNSEVRVWPLGAEGDDSHSRSSRHLLRTDCVMLCAEPRAASQS